MYVHVWFPMFRLGHFDLCTLAFGAKIRECEVAKAKGRKCEDAMAKRKDAKAKMKKSDTTIASLPSQLRRTFAFALFDCIQQVLVDYIFHAVTVLAQGQPINHR